MTDKVDTRATTSGLLTATGAETVYDTTVAISFCINGKAYSKAAVTDGATPTTDQNSGAAFTTLTASKGCLMVWCLNSSGTVSVAQGDVQNLDASNNFKVAPNFPYIDYRTYCPFAYTVWKAQSTAGTLTWGSSNWNATGNSVTHVNVHTLPARPQES